MDWLHIQTNAHTQTGLHDCRATRLEYTGKLLEFSFDDGFWITADNEFNHHPNGRVRRTGPAKMAIHSYDMETIYVFRNIRLFGKTLFTVRKNVPVGKLAEKLNSGKWELEFITRYVNDFTVMYSCDVWFNRRPYHMECQIETVYERIDYMWNGLSDDDSETHQQTSGGY